MANTKYKYDEARKAWSTLVWDGTYNADGSKHRKRVTSTKSSRDLERKVAEMKAKTEAGEPVAPSSRLFGDFAREWFEVTKAAKEKNTQRMYRTVVFNYLSFLDDVPLSDITFSHFQQSINRHLDHPKTCKNIKTTFSQIIRMAVKERLLPKGAAESILEGVSLPKYKRPEKRPLTALERDAFLAASASMDERKAAFVSILYYCGLRRQEALALRRTDFDWERGAVRVERVIIFDRNSPEIKPYPKSDRGTRWVPVPPPLSDRIRPFVDSSGDGFLFHVRGGPLMTEVGYRRMWEGILTALNVAAGYNPNAKKGRVERPIQGLTAHVFRHNYCTQLCYQVPAISTKKIAELLGDDERMVLEVYGHVVSEKEDVSGALASAFGIGKKEDVTIS